MRRKILTLIAYVMCVFGIASCAWGDVAINATNFPDETFRNVASDFDTDKNGTLSAAEIANIKVVDIPCDWLGVMGVPVTFLDKYNPKQFEILGMSGTNFSEGVPACHVQGTSRNAKISGKDIYRRIFIRRIGGIM
ncbi:MAG: hypothetical protein IJQ58_01195 [Synergistaceae bacterium]|nr:hypothetical protein [Synergistaceae bacterium]